MVNSRRQKDKERIKELIIQNNEVYREVDGYWVYLPKNSPFGYLNEYSLGILIEILTEMNEKYNKELKQCLEKANNVDI